jgi:hypothetical protein
MLPIYLNHPTDSTVLLKRHRQASRSGRSFSFIPFSATSEAFEVCRLRAGIARDGMDPSPRRHRRPPSAAIEPILVHSFRDSALETFDKALQIDPKYAPAHLYRGQVLYEQKQDYAGAVAAWERFMALLPKGEDRDRVAELVARARSKQPTR